MNIMIGKSAKIEISANSDVGVVLRKAVERVKN